MKAETEDKKGVRLGYIESIRANNQNIIQIALSVLLAISAIIIRIQQQSYIEIELFIFICISKKGGIEKTT